ncbi:outer membrane protein OmpA-like peptidoglycan-associated protein [Sphingomonas kaistensis]|uniref:Outer membrane protein OmpA-like peptidoglycan-associated protein n=1 Tax=Sphingomonas kaistensis TaxID=298708 RepID=A0A7X5Y8F3_9SPHN|nr:OmpA family protein [Sphingomonas kaistensis]NJC06723.1 outer membrane protein OmpA-like peptidoglycan-associated protein [Sphingomonas kaistensis]
MMIFFDSGGHEIRREWEPVLDQAATAASSGSRLRITGHSDRPGSPAVNRRFALQRAQVVADALVARGVQRSALTVVSEGEEAPFIPTADGVREIQNRRVDIRPE